MKPSSPSPQQIRAARGSMTQTAAGAVIGAALKTWQAWEAGTRSMPAAKFELFMLKTGQPSRT